MRQAVGSGTTSDTLDPNQIESSFTTQAGFQLRNNLTEIAPDNSVRPELAESWETSRDATTWIFRLRKGVEFHNGKTLNSTDVVNSFSYYRDKSNGSMRHDLLQHINSIEEDGSDIVKFTLNRPDPDFSTVVTDPRFPVLPIIDPTEDDCCKRTTETGVGTGPYQLKSFEPGVIMHTTRNPNYWKDDAAYFDEIQTISILDPSARENALLAGEVDIVYPIGAKSSSILGRSNTSTVLESGGRNYISIPMNANIPPFDNINVRRALKHSIDRNEVIDRVFRGYAFTGNDHPISKAYRFFSEDVEQNQFDTDKSRFFLNKAGHNGLRVPLHVSEQGAEGAENIAILYQDSARRAGIEIDLVREPSDGYWTNVWRTKPWVFSSWSGDLTELGILNRAWAPDGTWNESQWKDENFMKILNDVRTLNDFSLRKDLFNRVQAYLRDNGAIVVPVFLPFVQGVNTRLGMPTQIASNMELDGHKNSERWWFAD